MSILKHLWLPPTTTVRGVNHCEIGSEKERGRWRGGEDQRNMREHVVGDDFMVGGGYEGYQKSKREAVKWCAGCIIDCTQRIECQDGGKRMGLNFERVNGLEIQNPYEQLATIRQSHSIFDYIDDFEYVLSLVPPLPESQTLGYFIAGLKDDVKQQVRLHRPTSCIDAMYLAKDVELMLRPSDSNCNNSYVGAQPSDPVQRLLFRAGLLPPPPMVAMGRKGGSRDTRPVDPLTGRVLISELPTKTSNESVDV
ncbi:hypothetical protein E3N88_41992 [Mikania micrantha]|uniref:Ty3 transposon capsid-like protein domain-containing protein n=1 Tax=Mikania micrantha TaxID=192012 RepID=A0A5N6LJ14_9ASTR|nr:hypothetical protein E3N88_41992 [Mikania micrantha]